MFNQLSEAASAASAAKDAAAYDEEGGVGLDSVPSAAAGKGGEIGATVEPLPVREEGVWDSELASLRTAFLGG